MSPSHDHRGDDRKCKDTVRVARDRIERRVFPANGDPTLSLAVDRVRRVPFLQQASGLSMLRFPPRYLQRRLHPRMSTLKCRPGARGTTMREKELVRDFTRLPWRKDAKA